MSYAAKPSEGIDPTSFVNAVDLAIKQILTACRIPPTKSDNIQFAISHLLAKPEILDYSAGSGAKISQRQQNH
jgi:hypothetical protein